MTAIVCCVLVAPTDSVWARGKADKQLATEAHKHTKQGLRYLKVGKLDLAIEELQIAYGLSQDPELLFHIAEAYNKKQDYEQSLYYYKTFREHAPRAAQERGIDGIISALEDLIKSQAEGSEPEPPPPRPAAPVPPPQTATTPVPTTSSPAPEPRSMRGPAEPGSPGRGKRVTGALTGASGLILIGVGAYFGKIAGDRADEVSRVFATHGSWDASAASNYDEGRSAERTAIVLSAVGGAAVVTGAVLYYLGWRDRTHVEMTVSSASATLGWTCDF